MRSPEALGFDFTTCVASMSANHSPHAAKDVEEFTGGKIGAMFLTRLKQKSQAVHADERTGNLSSPAHQHITSADKRTGKLSSPPHC